MKESPETEPNSSALVSRRNKVIMPSSQGSPSRSNSFVDSSFDGSSSRQERLAEHGARLEEHRQRIAAHREVLTALPAEVTLSPKINPMSQRLTRADSVENVLLGAGKRYADKMELKRQELLAEREREITGSPSINKMSKSITRDGAVEDRLTSAHKEKQQKLAVTRESLKKAEEEELAGFYKPSITKSAQKLQRPGSASDLCIQWGNDSKKKIELERQKTQEEMEAEIHPPEISARSRKLAARVRQGRVEDQLLQAREASERDLSTTAELMFLANNPGYPRITEKAASLVRVGDIGERLYQQSLEKNSRLAEVRQDLQRHAEELASRNVSRSPSRKIEEELLRKGEELESKRELERKKIEAMEASRHTPAINEHSREIEKRLPHTAQQRILQSPRKTSSDGAHQDHNLTFRPELNPASVALADVRAARSGVGSVDRVDALLQYPHTTQRKLDEIRQRKLEEEMRECTFKPQVPRAHVSDGHRSVLDRLQKWHDRREAFLASERAKKEKEAMDACTFQPRIETSESTARGTPTPRSRPQTAPLSGSSASQISNSSSGSKAWGFDEFVERQKKGRQQLQERRTVPHATGEKWTPAPTTPQEFRFHSRVAVKATEKPVSVASRPAAAQSSSARPIALEDFTALVRNVWDDEDDTLSAPQYNELSVQSYAAQQSAASVDMRRESNGATDIQALIHNLTASSWASPTTPSYDGERKAADALEWAKRAREKHQSEGALYEEEQSQRPWREAPVEVSSPVSTPRTLDTAASDHNKRMAKARALKEDRNPDRVFADGSRWKGHTTVPQEFNIGGKRDSRISSLQKPVSLVTSE